MAATDAERMRRVRRHNKGDHSMCTAKTCTEVRADAATTIAAAVVPRMPATVEPGPEGAAAPIEAAVQAFVDALPYKDGDPRALLCLIAVRLARRVDETGAVPAAVAELRKLLMQLTEVPNGPAGPVDEIRLRAAARALDGLIAQSGRAA